MHPTYSPLIDGLTIAPSEIHGHGIITTRWFSPGESLGVGWWVVGELVIRTPLGGFINHSPLNPNCEKALRSTVSGPPNTFMETVRALVDIPPRTEITIKYDRYDPTAFG